MISSFLPVFFYFFLLLGKGKWKERILKEILVDTLYYVMYSIIHKRAIREERRAENGCTAEKGAY